MATSQNKLSIRTPALESLECKPRKMERKQVTLVDEKSCRPRETSTPENQSGLIPDESEPERTEETEDIPAGLRLICSLDHPWSTLQCQDKGCLDVSRDDEFKVNRSCRLLDLQGKSGDLSQIRRSRSHGVSRSRTTIFSYCENYMTSDSNSIFEEFTNTIKDPTDKEDTKSPPWEFLTDAQNSAAADDELTVNPQANATFITVKLSTGANASTVPQDVITALRENRVQKTAG
ncbi:hypothetical protein BTVI_90022 [Pitangus sulphuratus]|nr:hypothetical protein BTVI_90022 [Pitangus sulphuratus]